MYVTVGVFIKPTANPSIAFPMKTCRTDDELYNSHQAIAYGIFTTINDLFRPRCSVIHPDIIHPNNLNGIDMLPVRKIHL